MNNQLEINREISVPPNSVLAEKDYEDFVRIAYTLMSKHSQYFAPGEDINSLELVHLIPTVPETRVALYVGINDAVCNKGIVTPFLLRHAHNCVFVYDPQVFGGGNDVPAGTIDAQNVLNGFEPPNKTWDPQWTYVMISDAERSFESLWQEKGYIDMIPAKFEDFTLLTDSKQSRICFYVDPKAFEHPVNKSREYLKEAIRRGEAMADEFEIPDELEGEVDGLAPVILNKGEKLYVARTDFAPCDHAWSNLHKSNTELAVVNENSAIPLDIALAKPAVKPRYNKGLVPPKGSADMTTDWFYRSETVSRTPLLKGQISG